MKKTIFTLTIVTLMAGTMLTSCQSSTNKVKDAKENVKDAEDNMVEAKQELNQAINDSIQQFKKEAVEKISYYEKSIAELKAKIATEKKEISATYEKKLAELEQKNNVMKKKLDDYNDAGKDNWEIFKAEFSHDMDELGKALKDLTVKNLK